MYSTKPGPSHIYVLYRTINDNTSDLIIINLFFSVSPCLRVKQFFRVKLGAATLESFDIRSHKDENCAGATIGGRKLASRNDERPLEPEQEAVSKDQQKSAEEKPQEFGGP